MPEIKNLTDKNGNIVYPRTSADAIDINGDTLTNILNNKANNSDIPDLTNYATQTYVSNKIAEAQLDGSEVDLSGYATKDDLTTKADITSLSSYSTKSYVDTELAKKSNLSHTHDIYSSKTLVNNLNKKAFMKKVFINLPLKLPNHQDVLDKGVNNWIYPQSFTLDEDNEEIFILYGPDGGITKRQIVVYGFDGTYKCVFGAGDAGGEGIIVKTESDGKRYLYVKTTGTSLGKFDITTLPTMLSDIEPVAEYDLGLHYDFSYRNGTWLIEQAGRVLGSQNSRTHFAMFNDNFEKIGSLDLNRGITGLFTTDSQAYLPKRQGIALGSDFIYQSNGGYWSINAQVTPYEYCGLTILNRDGSINSELVQNPSKFRDIINEKTGNRCLRIENEGVYVGKNNDIYSLYVIENRDNTTWSKQGIIIFKEMCIEEGSIDFSECMQMIPSLNLGELERGVFPRAADGKIYNPISGEEFTTLNQIFKFMQDTEMKKFMVYTSSNTLLDIDNATSLPAGYLMTIENANNITFIVSLEGWAGIRKYCYYGNTMLETDRKCKEVFNSENFPGLSFDSSGNLFVTINGITHKYSPIS